MMLAREFASPGALVRTARLSQGVTQGEFAQTVGSRQSLISKYENDQVDPPATLVIHCVNILYSAKSRSVTEDSLVQLIRERLSGTEHAEARAAIASLVSGLRGA